MAKIIEIQCSPAISQKLIAALEFYVESHFPRGSSDCGQVAREELLNVIDTFRNRLSAGEPAGYSRRLNAMVKEGIRVYYEVTALQEGVATRHEMELVQAASKGNVKTDEDLVIAREMDRK